MKKVFYFLLMILLSSCNTSKDNINNLFPQKENLICEKINIDLNTLATPTRMLAIDSFLIVLDYNHKYFFNVFSLNTFRHLFSFGTKGRGPGEISHANVIFKVKKGFGIFDVDKQQVLFYNLDSLVIGPHKYIPMIKKFPNLKSSIYNISPIKDLGFIVSGDFTDKRFAFIQNDSIYKFAEYPEQSENNYPPEAFPFIYQGDIVCHPDLPKFVSISSNTPVLEFYFLSKSKFDLFTRIQYASPSVIYMTDNYRTIVSKQDNIFGFCDIHVTDKFVYALFSGRTSEEYKGRCYYGNKILVYDWNGHPIKILKTKIDIATFVIDKQNRMFAFSYYPEFSFYELKKL